MACIDEAANWVEGRWKMVIIDNERAALRLGGSGFLFSRIAWSYLTLAAACPTENWLPTRTRRNRTIIRMNRPDRVNIWIDLILYLYAISSGMSSLIWLEFTGRF
jgi:hypothetical protein